MFEYKPCPFCGGEAELDFADKSFDYIDSTGHTMYFGYFYTVKCKNIACGCSIGVYENPNMAIDAWNKRSDDEDGTT